MRMRTLQISAGVFITAVMLGIVAASVPASLSAQADNPRYGKWRLKPSDPAAPPSTNVMTYEPHEGKGMKITINTLQPDGSLTPNWGYTTMFDGKDEPMTGSRAKDLASVKILSDRVNEITYKTRRPHHADSHQRDFDGRQDARHHLHETWMPRARRRA